MYRSGPLRTAKSSSRTTNEPGATSIRRAAPRPKWKSSLPWNAPDLAMSAGVATGAADALVPSVGVLDPTGTWAGVADEGGGADPCGPAAAVVTDGAGSSIEA